LKYYIVTCFLRLTTRLPAAHAPGGAGACRRPHDDPRGLVRLFPVRTDAHFGHQWHAQLRHAAHQLGQPLAQ